MKLSFKNIEDHFLEFGIRVSTDNIKNDNIIENKTKVVHRDHAFKKNNILGFICRECNLQIKNDKSIPIYFFNGMKYDNSILLKSLCHIYKDEMTLNRIGNSCESFKMIDFKFKNMKYSYKLLDICNFIKGSLSELSKKFLNKDKIITKKHFPDNFELLKCKTAFPYEWLNENNIFDKELPPIDKFYSSLKLQNVFLKEYDKTLEIYKKLKCKNVKDYLEIYMKLDICLQSDIFNVFRNTIWNKFEVYCSKHITSYSLTLDLMLKYTKAKIELFKDIMMFDYVDKSILGGVCIASQNITDNDDRKSTISSCDVCSLYPYIMTQKLPISNYKYVSKLNKNRYGQNKNHSCLLKLKYIQQTKLKMIKFYLNFRH